MEPERQCYMQVQYQGAYQGSVLHHVFQQQQGLVDQPPVVRAFLQPLINDALSGRQQQQQQLLV